MDWLMTRKWMQSLASLLFSHSHLCLSHKPWRTAVAASTWDKCTHCHTLSRFESKSFRLFSGWALGRPIVTKSMWHTRHTRHNRTRHNRTRHAPMGHLLILRIPGIPGIPGPGMPHHLRMLHVHLLHLHLLILQRSMGSLLRRLALQWCMALPQAVALQRCMALLWMAFPGRIEITRTT